MRVSRSIAAVALGSALLLTGCSEAGEDQEDVDTSIGGDAEDGENSGVEEGEGEEGEEGEEED